MFLSSAYSGAYVVYVNMMNDVHICCVLLVSAARHLCWCAMALSKWYLVYKSCFMFMVWLMKLWVFVCWCGDKRE